MKNKPGINHKSVLERSLPACSFTLIQPEKKIKKTINKILIRLLIKSEEEAIDILLLSLLSLLTYFMCAFFKRPPFVVSKTDVTAKNNAHVPTCAVVKTLTSMIKLIRPKNVSENR